MATIDLGRRPAPIQGQAFSVFWKVHKIEKLQKRDVFSAVK